MRLNESEVQFLAAQSGLFLRREIVTRIHLRVGVVRAHEKR